MYKIFSIAAAMAIMPFTQKISPAAFDINNTAIAPPSFFSYKNPLPANFWEPEKKPTQAWSQNWMAQAQENIRKSEYHFKWEERYKAYCTPNRKNNLRFFYNDKGFSVEPGTTRIPLGEFDPLKRPDEIKYKNIPNWKVKFNLDEKQVGNGKWQIVNNKAEYITDKITVQYINNDEGMRQNFLVRSPLSKIYELKINFSIKTNLNPVLNNNRLQFLHKKTAVLNYEDLKAWDANGKLLEAVMGKTKRNKYFIKVNTVDAVYPITIDPVSTTPAAMVQSDNASARMGSCVAPAGDVNGDGYSDVIVGAYFYNNGQPGEGAFFLYHGSATGISTTAAATVESDLGSAFFGVSVASAGDVNGDGFSDVIVGASGYNNGNVNEGAIFIYHGSGTGINTTPAVTIESNLAGANLGFSVSSAGDVNGDGFSDVIAGAPNYNNGHAGEGAVFVYHGSAGGIVAAPVATIESNLAGAGLGFSVSSAGNVNGDGFSDIVAGARLYSNVEANEGAIFVYHGSASGINTTPAATVESNQASAILGCSVSTAGDVNGDGYSDVIAGAPQYNNGQNFEGVAFIFHGSIAGISTTAAATLESNQVNAFFGNTAAAACAGDVNSDGYSDVIVGASGYDNGELDEGASFVFLGSATGVNTTATAILESNQASAGMCPGASAGDVNGDGYSDVIVGAAQYDNGQTDEGVAFVYHGSAAGLSATPNSTPDDADQAFAGFGISVASAGDVNGDGYSDVIIGADGYTDGANANEGRAFVYHGSASGLSATPNSTPDDADQAGSGFGVSVASAGDVNGDGYSDVIIGANGYNDGANMDEGQAFVYHGSASGLSATPNNTPDDANQTGALFGTSVASAGDINGDGYSDVIIGAFLFNDGVNSDEGLAFIYHGSASGLSATPNSTPDDADQAGAGFGISVASAGDVNGDGFCDIIIGASNYVDGGNIYEGRAFVYHGSASGLSATPNSTPDDANQADAQLGASVASAGDVNGDGYGDIIIGAPTYDGGFSNEGQAFVYYGSATGLSASPDNTPDDADQADALFGWSVSSAGDVNGDGYSDVLIGAEAYTDGANAIEGRAYIYHGSATGLSPSPSSSPDDANQSDVRFGKSVASAGDVNGDGYSDVIIGAPYYADGANPFEGRAFVYNGNELTDNKRNNLRLYNSDLSTPINSSNFIFGNFGAGLFAKSFLGKARGKMVWETRINYNAYSGNPITNSTLFTDQQSTYTDLGLNGVELKSIITKLLASGVYTKLRARVKYDPATAITGQVYGPWRNVSAVIDANSLGALPVELVSFDAAWLQKGKSAAINFTTDKETGICCFDIEKSLDGFSFNSITSIAAKNTSHIQSYRFVDNDAVNKKQFYRLKIKADNGKSEYSNIRQLQSSGSVDILVFPNPAINVLQLQLNGSYDKMNVQIVNTAGQIVKQINNLSVSNRAITIPVQNLPAGQYWLRLQSGSEKQVLQFVKE